MAILRHVHRMTPKWSSTLQGQMYPIWLYVLVVSTSLYLISTLFTLRPAVLELQAQGLQAISRKVHQITPNWLWSLQGQMYPIYLLLLSTSLQFQSVSLYAIFEIQVILRQVHRKPPKWPWLYKVSFRLFVSKLVKWNIFLCFKCHAAVVKQIVNFQILRLCNDLYQTSHFLLKF